LNRGNLEIKLDGVLKYFMVVWIDATFTRAEADRITDIFHHVQNHFQQTKNEQPGPILGECAPTLSLSTLGVKHRLNREKVESKEINIQRVSTRDNMADILTKPLPRPVHEDLTRLLNMGRIVWGNLGEEGETQ
jgi:hypothetical protein